MPPNEIKDITSKISLSPPLNRSFSDIPRLKIPDKEALPQPQNELSRYLPPLPRLNNKFRSLNIFINPRIVAELNLFSDLAKPRPPELPSIENNDRSEDGEDPRKERGPSLYISLYNEKRRVPTSPASTEESGGLVLGVKLDNGWKLEFRNGVHGYFDPNNPNNL